MKKRYEKPEMKTRQLELGVFGDYSGRRGDQGGHRQPDAVSVIESLRLHME